MLPAYGLYTHIRANRIRSAALLAGLFFLVYVIVYALAIIFRVMVDPDASLDWYLGGAFEDLKRIWPFATAAALLWILIGYRLNLWMVEKASGSQGVTRREQPRLYNLLENLCIARGIPMPKLRIIDTPVLNAFASGLNQKQYTVTVTQGLLDRLDDAEVEAVLAHELTHIRNGDVRMMVIALIIAGAVGLIAEIGFRAMFHTGRATGASRSTSWPLGGSRGSSDRGKGGGAAIIAIIIAVVLIVLAWVLSQVIRFSLSRSREYLADAGAVELTQNADAMIMALRKIEGRGELPGTASAVMEMCIDNPHSGIVDMFATHPSIDKRVAALVRMAGGRDPGPVALPELHDDGHDFSADPAALAEAQAQLAAAPEPPPAEPPKPA